MEGVITKSKFLGVIERRSCIRRSKKEFQRYRLDRHEVNCTLLQVLSRSYTKEIYATYRSKLMLQLASRILGKFQISEHTASFIEVHVANKVLIHSNLWMCTSPGTCTSIVHVTISTISSIASLVTSLLLTNNDSYRYAMQTQFHLPWLIRFV
jgi:hypothetical protein